MAAIFRLPEVRADSTRFRRSPWLESIGCWLKGSVISNGSAGAAVVCVVFCAAAFRAALAFAMLSLRALDDFEPFLVSISDCCSADRSGAVDVADDFLESAEDGDRLSEEFDGTFRVFFTCSVCDGGAMFDSVGFTEGGLLRDWRGLGAVVPVLFIPPYRLVLVEGRFNFEGLSGAAATESWSVDAMFVGSVRVADILDLDGRRIVDGCWEDNRSLPIG